MIPRELPKLAREHHVAVGEDQLCLAEAARIPQNLAGRRMTRVILVADVELELAERYPAPLSAPATVHELLLVRQQLPKRRARFRRQLLLKLGDELELLPHSDVELIAH